jgi:hypothetical protein
MVDVVLVALAIAQVQQVTDDMLDIVLGEGCVAPSASYCRTSLVDLVSPDL